MVKHIVTQEANDYSVGTNTSSAVNIANFGEAKSVTMIASATLGASATITAQLKGCATASGTYTDIAGGTITLSANGNSYVTIDIPADVNYLKVALTVATAASKACVALIFGKIRINT